MQHIRMVALTCVYLGICVCQTVAVSEQLEAGVPWGDAERERFRIARAYAGHGMDECGHILRTEFGVTSASQPNVSRWESGSTKRPQCVNELLAYCDVYGPRDRSTRLIRNVPRTGQVADSTSTDPPAGSTSDEVDEFDRLAVRLAGEPLLGAAQLELVRGMIHRLASGPPLSAEDRAMYRDLLRILRVPDA